MALELCSIHVGRFVDFYLTKAEEAAQEIIAADGGVPDEVDIALATFRTFLRQLRDAGQCEVAFQYIALFTAQANYARNDAMYELTQTMALMPGVNRVIADYREFEDRLTESN